MDRIQKSGTYPYLSTSYYYALRPEYIEPVLYRNSEKIKAFSWISFESARTSGTKISSTFVSDTSTLFKTKNLRFYSVTPYLYETSTDSNDYLELSY